MKQLKFSDPGSQAGTALREWWNEIKEGKKKDGKSNTGDRAALRRCENLSQVAAVPAFHDLCWRLKQVAEREEFFVQADRLLPIAALAARIKDDIPGTLPKQMAVGEGVEPTVSQMRFRRLLQCQDRETLFPLLRRALALLGNEASLVSLADSVYWWNDERRKRWAYDYFGELEERKNTRKSA